MTDIDIIVSKFLTLLLQSILVICIPVLVVQARRWLEAVSAAAWAQFGTQQQALLLQAARIAVQAAQQSGLAGLIVNEGRVKKDFAIAVVHRMLSQYGIELESDVISNTIESAVSVMKSSQPVVPEVVVPEPAVIVAQ